MRGLECGMVMTNASAVTVTPAGSAWAGLVRGRAALSDEKRRFRAQLGLKSDGPMVMAGHQPVVWHPGILAKMVAVGAAARVIAHGPPPSSLRSDTSSAGAGEGAWVVVDQDEVDPWVVRHPVRRGDARLETRLWRLDGAERAGEGHVPGMNMAAVRGVKTPRLAAGERFGAAGVEQGLAKIAEAMDRHAGAASGAMQVGLATRDLARDWAGDVTVFAASAIAGTELFAKVVEKMRSDPARVISTYNEAVRRHAGARIAPLGEGELPLWYVARRIGAPRKRGTVAMLGSVPVGELMPRALLMTGLLRWAGCDMFVHGTGGAGGAESEGAGGYDAITTEWFREWLGVEIAPTAMVTATVRLNITTAEPIITPEAIARASWLAHAARHRPELLADAEGEAVRGPAVATLTRLKHRRDPESRKVKLEAFRTLHGTLETVRARHVADLGRLDAAAANAAARREEAEIVADRTWAFPMYERGQMEDLKRGIEDGFR